MPTIVIPENIVIENPTDPTDSFTAEFCKWFICLTILNDPSWGKSANEMYTAMEIRGLVKDAKPGDPIKLTKDQYEKLRARVAEPTNSYNPAAIIQCKAFLDAVLEPAEK